MQNTKGVPVHHNSLRFLMAAPKLLCRNPRFQPTNAQPKDSARSPLWISSTENLQHPTCPPMHKPAIASKQPKVHYSQSQTSATGRDPPSPHHLTPQILNSSGRSPQLGSIGVAPTLLHRALKHRAPPPTNQPKLALTYNRCVKLQEQAASKSTQNWNWHCRTNACAGAHMTRNNPPPTAQNLRNFANNKNQAAGKGNLTRPTSLEIGIIVFSGSDVVIARWIATRSSGS